MREWVTNYHAQMDHGTSDKNNKQFTLEARGARVISIRLRFNALPHKSFPFRTRNACIFQEQSIRHHIHMCTSYMAKYNAYRVSNFRQIAPQHASYRKFSKENKKSFFSVNELYISFKNMNLQRMS